MVNPEEWIPHFGTIFKALMCNPNVHVAPKVAEFLKDMDRKRQHNEHITKRQLEFLAVIFFRDVCGISGISMPPRREEDEKKNAYVYFRELLGDDSDLDSFLDK